MFYYKEEKKLDNKNTNHIQEELVHCALALEGERDSG